MYEDYYQNIETMDIETMNINGFELHSLHFELEFEYIKILTDDSFELRTQLKKNINYQTNGMYLQIWHYIISCICCNYIG